MPTPDATFLVAPARLRHRLRARASRVLRASRAVVPTLVAVVWLLLPLASASADTLKVKVPGANDGGGETFTGTVIRQDRRNVEFAFDLFRLDENGQLERLQIRVPRSLVAPDGLVRDRTPDDNLRVPRDNATRAEKVAAAGRIIRRGTTASLHHAHRLLASVVADAAAAADPDDDGPSEAVVVDLLRFRLVDLVGSWRTADAATRRTLEKQLANGPAVSRLMVEYVAVLTLAVRILLESGGRRHRLAEQLRVGLRFQREDYIRFVRRNADRKGRPGFDDAAYIREMHDRLARIKALVHTPSTPLALTGANLTRDGMQALIAMRELASRLGDPVARPVAAAVTARIAGWDARITPNLVAVPLQTRALQESNRSAAEWGAAALTALKAAAANNSQRARVDEEYALATVINEYRDLLGLTRMGFNVKLHAASAAHARACRLANKLDHNLNGTSPATRARNAHYRGGAVGENLYRAGADNDDGQSAAEVLEAWQQSADHHLNLLRPDEFKWIGVARRGDVWCLLVGA